MGPFSVFTVFVGALPHVLGAVDKTSSSFSAHGKIGNFIIIIWLYYNFAAESFHTKKLSNIIYSIEIEFYSKKTKIVFEPPFGAGAPNPPLWVGDQPPTSDTVKHNSPCLGRT